MTDKTAEETLNKIEEILEEFNQIPEPTDSIKGTPEPTIAKYTVEKNTTFSHVYSMPFKISQRYVKYQLGEFHDIDGSKADKVIFELEGTNQNGSQPTIRISQLYRYLQPNGQWKATSSWLRNYVGYKMENKNIRIWPDERAAAVRIKIFPAQNYDIGFEGILKMKIIQK